MNLRRARDMLSQKKEKKKYTYFKKKTIGMNRNQVMRNHEHANRLLVLPSFDVGFLNHYRCPDIFVFHEHGVAVEPVSSQKFTHFISEY